MIQRISIPVSVILAFNHNKRKSFPVKVLWEGTLHKIVKIGLHHTYRTGRTLYHVFSVATETLFLRLVMNTETLEWKLEEIADGLPA